MPHRYVDALPPPAVKREKKVIVASVGRNGTMGLYEALRILGYRPYHVVEIFKNGIPHMKVMSEAVRATWFGEGERYTREDFEKWIGEYDSITDIPDFLLEDLVAAYPDAKYILTYREPDAWLRSVKNTFVRQAEKSHSLTARVLRYFDPYMWNLFTMTDLFHRVIWQGRGIYDDDAALGYYRAHNELARKIIPPGQLVEIKLEDGLGWEQICPFLSVDIPDVPYPRTNEPAKFAAFVGGLVRGAMRRAVKKILALVVVPLVSLGAWYYLSNAAHV